MNSIETGNAVAALIETRLNETWPLDTDTQAMSKMAANKFNIPSREECAAFLLHHANEILREDETGWDAYHAIKNTGAASADLADVMRWRMLAVLAPMTGMELFAAVRILPRRERTTMDMANAARNYLTERAKTIRECAVTA